MPRTATHPANRLSGYRQTAMAIARQRLAIGILLVTFFTLVLGARLAYLALFDGAPRHSGPAAVSPFKRADIVDRNGIALAYSYDAYALAARPRDIMGDREELLVKLAAILPEREPTAIRAALYHDGKFRYISRRILPEQAAAIRRLGDPGITLEREPERLYPHASLAAHYIGYTGIDGRGEGGIELAFEERLTDPALRDQPLMLSMDVRIQQVLENELAKRMEETEAEGAVGVVMDIHSGEVLALASLPSFDANKPGGLVGMPSHMNRATLGVYELGSTFKPFTIAMALESGVVTDLGERFAMSPVRAGNHRIRDLHPRASPITVPEIIIYSSNTGSARIAERLGRERQENFLRALGMMDRAPGEIAEKGRPLTPPANNWGTAAVMTVGFGHGIAVTPLHLATAYCTLVNGGIHRPATFLKVTGKREGTRVFSEQTSHRINAMLRLVALDGTGRRADAFGYRVGGKTGTAEKQSASGRGYDHRRNITSFAGAFPMDDPRYVVVTMIDEPKGANRQAGFVVGPVTRNVVNRIAPILGVAPSETLDIDVSEFDGLWTPRAVRGEASIR